MFWAAVLTSKLAHSTPSWYSRWLCAVPCLNAASSIRNPPQHRQVSCAGLMLWRGWGAPCACCLQLGFPNHSDCTFALQWWAVAVCSSDKTTPVGGVSAGVGSEASTSLATCPEGSITGRFCFNRCHPHARKGAKLLCVPTTEQHCQQGRAIPHAKGKRGGGGGGGGGIRTVKLWDLVTG